MKVSARNQFEGTVRAIRSGAVNDQVELDIPGGLHIAATITRESAVELRLQVGIAASALVKASSVLLATDYTGVRYSARNQLLGSVARIAPGAVNTEVVVAVAGGHLVTAMITNESAQSLGLQVGGEVLAMFKVSSVILAVKA
ncbi:MAG: TOBE domain-containing protein [Proteobacteria bacterium]|nr:TOBE domain-containing protein [Pseudomonadota bacterium]